MVLCLRVRSVEHHTCSIKADLTVLIAIPSIATLRRCAEKIAFMHAMYWLVTSGLACRTRMRADGDEGD